MKRYFEAGKTGVVIGLIASIIFSIIYGQGAYFPTNPFSEIGKYYMEHFNNAVIIAISGLIWGLIGVLFEATGQLFNQNWSLVKASFLHFIFSICGFIFLAILAGWFPLRWNTFFAFLITFIVIYLLVYIINYIIMLHRIKEINHKIK